jgi:hypothetical protein
MNTNPGIMLSRNFVYILFILMLLLLALNTYNFYILLDACQQIENLNNQIEILQKIQDTVQFTPDTVENTNLSYSIPDVDFKMKAGLIFCCILLVLNIITITTKSY